MDPVRLQTALLEKDESLQVFSLVEQRRVVSRGQNLDELSRVGRNNWWCTAAAREILVGVKVCEKKKCIPIAFHEQRVARHYSRCINGGIVRKMDEWHTRWNRELWNRCAMRFVGKRVRHGEHYNLRLPDWLWFDNSGRCGDFVLPNASLLCRNETEIGCGTIEGRTIAEGARGWGELIRRTAGWRSLESMIGRELKGVKGMD